jgi:hypothetical protein
MIVVPNVIVIDNYLLLTRMENIDHDDLLRFVTDHHLLDYICW